MSPLKVDISPNFSSVRARSVTVCVRMRRALVLLLLLFAAVESNSMTPPGKPVLLDCRSPEKETFTCWWEPGSDGGLPTKYRLYYERENLEGVYECPDYHSAGSNSCYFAKNHTSIWIYYYLTVVAFNDLGNATSDTLKVDVMEIVKPDPPENVSLTLEVREENANLHITWQRPHNTDTTSGWVTVEYELRVKEENSIKWKAYTSGKQPHFSLYSIGTGVYTVQVRCRLDHGYWSEWSNTTSLKVPRYLQNDKPFWIMVSILFAIPVIAALCILIIKRKNVKQYVLPPVPGPKIKGVDFRLLKSGQSEDIINAMITNQNFPLMVAWKDQMEEYLLVTENDNGILLDHSSTQKKRKSLSIPAGFCLDSEVQCKEDTPVQNDWEKTHLPDQQPQWPNIHFVNTEATGQSLSDAVIKPLPNSSYVDIQRDAENIQKMDVEEADYSKVNEVNGDNILILGNKNIPLNDSGYMMEQREDLSGDYSRVKEVDNDSVFLQTQHMSDDTCRKETGNHRMDCANQKPKNPHVTESPKFGMCTELIGSGYVDSIPAPPLM